AGGPQHDAGEVVRPAARRRRHRAGRLRALPPLARRHPPPSREGGPVERLTPGSIFASASICPGDSGGPARSQATGDVVGVVSAGVMDDDDQTRDPTTFTRLDTWRSLFVNAKLIVQGSSPAEVPPVDGCIGERARDV